MSLGGTARVIALCAATSIAAPTPAVAAIAIEEPSVDELEAGAIKAYESGDFEEAARLFEAAFNRTKDPNLLYNVGRVYEEAGKLEKAIEYYDRFVHAEGVGLDTRVVASERLSQLKKIVGSGEEEPHEDPIEDEPEASPPVEPEPESPPPTKDEPTKPPSRAMRISGIVLLSVGGAALITSGVLGGLAVRNNNRLDDELGDDPLRVQQRGQNQALATDVLIGVGSAFVVVGATLVIVNQVRKARSKSGNATLSPMLSPSVAGLSWQARF